MVLSLPRKTHKNHQPKKVKPTLNLSLPMMWSKYKILTTWVIQNNLETRLSPNKLTLQNVLNYLKILWQKLNKKKEKGPPLKYKKLLQKKITKQVF